SSLSSASGLFFLVHPFQATANICLITLHKAAIKAEQRAVSVLNGLSDSVTEIPRGFVRNSKHSFELQSRDAFFRFANQISSDEPFTKRQVRVMKNSSSSYAKVIATWCTLKLVALIVARNLFRSATNAANAFGPSQLLKSNTAFLVSVELGDE